MNAAPSFPSLFAAPTQAQIQEEFKTKWQQLLNASASSTLSAPRNRRFQHEAWLQQPAALLSAHVWELFSDTLQIMVDQASLPADIQKKLSFSIMQWAQAACPANFLALNPEAQQKLMETQGASLLAGVHNFLNDIQKGRLTQTDESGFKLGQNVASTPGSVVFKNELFELIHYQPSTPTVKAVPLLIVPPCINKYYILDLQERNSFVKYAVDQSLQVFLMSWRNPMPDDNDGVHQATWGDYLQHGVLEAIQAVQAISQQEQIHGLGFCVGGTLLSSALALAHAQGQQPCKSLTLLTTMLDFYDVGPLKAFVDEASVLMRDWQIGSGGLLPAADLMSTFAFLRPGELVWNYVTDNYLKGETPAPFDLLYWNADGTNLPGPFFSWYYRNAYLRNALKDEGGVRINGHELDFRNLSMPAYVYASEQDHIVPWESSYRSARLLKGSVQFVLGASGHIAGVINPPANQRRHYWVSDTVGVEVDPHEWRVQTQRHEGSWWPHWAAWVAQQSNDEIAAPKALGGGQYAPLYPAPGQYVQVRAL